LRDRFFGSDHDHAVWSQEMKEERVTIPIGRNQKISALLNAAGPFAGETAVVLAHGAANDMKHPLLAFLAEGLSEEGYTTLRFNFFYRERGKDALDSQDMLYVAWESAYRFLCSGLEDPPKKIIAAGKSLGGRIASQMVAEERLAVQGLIFLGYPLHAPGRKSKLRDSHLYDIMVPMLFFSGTRDPLCDLELLQSVLSRLGKPAELQVIEGGDHSFSVPKSYAAEPELVYERILARIVEWLNKEKASA
jgi:predicted alpha/beta-hydrolase family hydrolase